MSYSLVPYAIDLEQLRAAVWLASSLKHRATCGLGRLETAPNSQTVISNRYPSSSHDFTASPSALR